MAKSDVSVCCTAPLKYRKATVVSTGEEIMVPFCCKCEKETTAKHVQLTKAQQKANKDILWRALFPGIDVMKALDILIKRK